jgi:hypothetical protein
MDRTTAMKELEGIPHLAKGAVPRWSSSAHLSRKREQKLGGGCLRLRRLFPSCCMHWLSLLHLAATGEAEPVHEPCKQAAGSVLENLCGTLHCWHA